MNAEAKLSANYTAAGGKEATAIPWATIIELLMSLFGGCPMKRAKRFARLFPEATKKMLADRLTDGPKMGPKDRKALVEGAYMTLFSLSDAQLEEMR